MITRLVTSIKGVSRVDINIPDRTVNVTYDSRITDAHVIRMTLLKTGYKTIKEEGYTHIDIEKIAAMWRTLGKR